MRLLKFFYKLLLGFINRLKDDHVGAYASQAALFMIIALFPALILLLNILQYTPVTEEFLFQITTDVIPASFEPFAATIIHDVYHSSSGTLLSISIIFTIWSASRGVLALINGFATINHTKENRNYFFLRLIAAVYTILFILIIVLMLVILVFGNSLLQLFRNSFPLVYDIAYGIISSRNIYAPILMTLLFVFMYRLVPNGRKSLISHLPGACFSSVGWLTFSFLYSYYVDHFAHLSYSYGSLTILVLLMLWLYICMYIIFIGAEINNYFHAYFRYLKRRFRRKE